MRHAEFKINEYLSLKLVGSKTVIYVNSKKFRQCKYVLLDIPVEDIGHYSSFNSIDEVIDNLDRSLEQNPEIISPEVEFWAHCSNLQAWEENNYNTDLLDSLLSFPLLKELTQEGDGNAKKAFKEEIAKRLMRGNLSIIEYLTLNGYLEFLTDEELRSVLSSDDCLLFEAVFNIFKSNNAELFSIADSIYRRIGNYLSSSIKRKLQQIFETENVKDLSTIFIYRMLDVLPDEEILVLFDPPSNLLEKTLTILNKINYKEIKIEEGLFSKKIENILDDKIEEMLLKIVYKGNISFFILWTLDLLKYLENSQIEFHDYLKYE